ncbi:hypothetical protein ACRAWD_10370 [Caulobacter segnis]
MSQSPFASRVSPPWSRAGAADHAWTLFVGAGLAASDDPAVLTPEGADPQGAGEGGGGRAARRTLRSRRPPPIWPRRCWAGAGPTP